MYRVHRAIAKEIRPEELTPMTKEAFDTGDEDEKGDEKNTKEVEKDELSDLPLPTWVR